MARAWALADESAGSIPLWLSSLNNTAVLDEGIEQSENFSLF